jgi:hypothetical protein
LSGRLLVGCLFAFGSWGIYFERIDWNRNIIMWFQSPISRPS